MTSHKIEKGDIAYIELDSWILNPDGTKKLHNTTHEELAKKEKIHEEKRVYSEVPVFIGQGRLHKGLEDEIIGKSVGDEGEVTVPPEKGAGPRDPKLISLRPMREFLKKKIEPELGMPVVIDGKTGYISSITAGRVRVDFNSPLAGKTLLYKYKITKKASNLEEKILGVIEMDYGLSDQFKLKVEKDEVEVVVPDVCKTDERWFIVKFRIVADLRELQDLKKTRFIEEYGKKEEKKEEKKADEPEEPEKKADEKIEEEKTPEETKTEEKAPEEL